MHTCTIPPTLPSTPSLHPLLSFPSLSPSAVLLAPAGREWFIDPDETDLTLVDAATGFDCELDIEAPVSSTPSTTCVYTLPPPVPPPPPAAAAARTVRIHLRSPLPPSSSTSVPLTLPPFTYLSPSPCPPPHPPPSPLQVPAGTAEDLPGAAAALAVALAAAAFVMTGAVRRAADAGGRREVVRKED